MLSQILNLASRISERRTSQEKFVLMLGAGASLSSGVKLTRVIMEELVTRYAQGGAPASLESRFDKLWQDASSEERRRWLDPYLTGTPSVGYQRLAALIQRGFFDIAITYNFDRLLERALDDVGFRDYKTIIRGETGADAIATLMHSKEPRVKILKTHGSLYSANTFLFTKEEMANYPPDLAALINEFTGRDIIICGYAFNDLCVKKAFNDSKEAESIYFVNPSGAAEDIKGILRIRRSQDRVIDGDLGRFDEFFDALYKALISPTKKEDAQARQNPFKFLDHYNESNSPWFLGRRKLTRSLAGRFRANPAAALFLYGKAKAGKTSLIKAGFIPALGSDAFDCVYIRCRKDLDVQVMEELERRFPGATTGADWSQTVARLQQLTSKRIVIVLDQFERPARAYDDAPDRYQAMFSFVRGLLTEAADRVSFVFVSVDDKSFWKCFAMLNAGPRTDLQEIKPLSAARVARIVRFAARKGGVTLDPKMVETFCGLYRDGLDRPTDKRVFTLLHVQTLCYYLVRGYAPEWRGYDQLPNPGLKAALDSTSDELSLVDLLDDLPAADRSLIRSFLKVICDPNGNTRMVVEFIRDHFPEIREDRFPETF